MMKNSEIINFILRIINPQNNNFNSMNFFRIDGRINLPDLKKYACENTKKQLDSIRQTRIVVVTSFSFNKHNDEIQEQIFKIETKDKKRAIEIAQAILNLYKDNKLIENNTKISFEGYKKVKFNLDNYLEI